MKVKRQHYVPRFYLNYFADNKNQVWVYDKEIRKAFQTSIINIACEG